MIIDAHTHNSTEAGRIHNAQDLIASMDEAGIDYSLLIADGFVSGGTTTEEAIKISAEYPRIKAIGSVTYATLDAAQIRTLINYWRAGKIYGVKLYPGYENFYPSDERLLPLYARCQEIGMPIIFHTGFLMVGFPGLLKQAHPLNVDDVASAFPALKIVMAHCGSPWIIDAAAVALRNKNVYTDVSGYFKEFSPITRSAVDSFIQDLNEWRSIVGDFRRCLFATDWYLYSQKEYLGAVRQLPLSEEEKDLVFWKNASEVFGLDL